jgi:hypothetical protein
MCWRCLLLTLVSSKRAQFKPDALAALFAILQAGALAQPIRRYTLARRYRRINLLRKLRGLTLDVLVTLLLGVLIGNGLLRLAARPADEPFTQAEVPGSFSIVNTNYDVSSGTPTRVERVTFEMLMAGGVTPETVTIQLMKGSGDWYGCSSPDGVVWECPVPGVPVIQVNDLIVAVS